MWQLPKGNPLPMKSPDVRFLAWSIFALALSLPATAWVWSHGERPASVVPASDVPASVVFAPSSSNSSGPRYGPDLPRHVVFDPGVPVASIPFQQAVPQPPLIPGVYIDARTGNKTLTIPSCQITSPKNEARYAKPGTIHVTADARPMADEPVEVEFLLCKGIPPTEENFQIKIDTSAPYSADFSNVPAGKYSIFANARRPDQRGNQSVSRVDVTVEAGKADTEKASK